MCSPILRWIIKAIINVDSTFSLLNYIHTHLYFLSFFSHRAIKKEFILSYILYKFSFPLPCTHIRVVARHTHIHIRNLFFTCSVLFLKDKMIDAVVFLYFDMHLFCMSQLNTSLFPWYHMREKRKRKAYNLNSIYAYLTGENNKILLLEIK